MGGELELGFGKKIGKVWICQLEISWNDTKRTLISKGSIESKVQDAYSKN